MGSISPSALFTPVKVGTCQLKHRVAFAPCTRFRNTPGAHAPIVPLVKKYYEQRASVSGTLIVTEATIIAEKAGGMDGVPGIYSEDQIRAWKEITDAVHAKGSFIYVQLWALGRAARPQHLQGHPHISVSPIRLSTAAANIPTPRELTLEEIKEYVELFATRRKKCDGGWFMQDVSNKRNDEYGGSIENRSRFGLEVVDAVVKAIGAERVAVRLSPWSTHQDMKMENPVPQFEHFISCLVKTHPSLAYLHFIEPTISGLTSAPAAEWETNDYFRKAWGPRPFISCGDYTRESAINVAETKGDIIAFGRAFIANPDLPFRLEKDLQLNPVDTSTFYVGGEKGYTDYPFTEEFLQGNIA
ncbi:NADH:flavin oxidoreductase/NADH oxidase [Coprinopsis sp. MPI-PUGE-AT-0042]|nr:NADH:flavin oxidoreductase/NADH oxidase [Coprinopsis sp. MPI-PUGE-AT-0042]